MNGTQYIFLARKIDFSHLISKINTHTKKGCCLMLVVKKNIVEVVKKGSKSCINPTFPFN